jgi:Cu2+-exporting ATPase
MKMNTKKIYTCPMHPEVRRDKPGICPKCGMNLLPEKPKNKHEKHVTYEKHAGHSIAMFKRKFWISFILTIPVVIYSGILQTLFGFQPPQFPGSNYVPLILSSFIFFYCGWVFIVGAYRELRARLPGMMTLITLAITAAFVYSVAVTFIPTGEPLFWELTTLITIMLLGHFMEMRAVQSSQKALQELAKLLPDTAEVIRGKKTEVIPLDQLRVDDIILIRPGSKVPADGIVIEGTSDVNEALLTGESKPVKKTKDNGVIAGSINGDGSLKVKVTSIGENTFLAGVMRLVAEAQASKSKLQILSDRAAFYLTVIAILAGSLTFISWNWLFVAGIAFATERLVTVLVIACPHALGLAVPLVSSISTTMGAQNGLLVKQRLALEAARNIEIVMFDKTGTLTKGEYGVNKIITNPKYDENKILQFAASVDKPSEHFVAKAIVKEAEKRNLRLVPVKDFQRVPGKGVKGRVNKSVVFVGGEAMLKERNLQLSPDLKKKIEVEAKGGKTIIYVIVDDELAGAIALADIIRDESREAVQKLKSMGVKVAMLTGDSEGVAKWVAQELGIDEYFAHVLPQEKSKKVKLLQSRGLKVAMVGDGINDAPALTQADVGIAIGAGTNVAIESAGIILVRNDPRDIVKIISLSKHTYSKMLQNLFWATGYNIIAIPLAAGILAQQGILLQPAVGAIFMSASTVIVAVNALLLRRVKLL